MHPFLFIMLVWATGCALSGALWATIGQRRKALRQKIDFIRHGEGN